MELIDGFISSGDADHGIIVTSDVNPSPKYTLGFKFKNSAAAVLLGKADNGSGFRTFRQYEYPEHMDKLESTVEFRKDPRRNIVGVRRMRNILSIEETPQYKSIIIEKMMISLESFLRENDLRMKDMDLIIPSQYPTGIPEELADRTGLGKEKVVILPKHYGPLYTTGPGFGLRWAMKKGMWERSRNILFLAVGPGIKVSLAHYLNEI
jgi:3-oxoacyl-[acyl-carrier-protein] synthase III